MKERILRKLSPLALSPSAHRIAQKENGAGDQREETQDIWLSRKPMCYNPESQDSMLIDESPLREQGVPPPHEYVADIAPAGIAFHSWQTWIEVEQRCPQPDLI